MGEGNQNMNNSNGASSKAELQQQVEAKRDEIANTVDEIRMTVTDEVRGRKMAVKQAMDWRHYVKKSPVACVGGAVAIGCIAGKLVGDKIFEEHPEPTWRDRVRDRTDNFIDNTEMKVDEWRGRAQGESKWKARTHAAFSSGGNLVVRELFKTAQRMIIPAVVAAITGKLASNDETTIVEKDVHKSPGPGPDIEVTKNVTKYEDGDLKADRDDSISL